MTLPSSAAGAHQPADDGGGRPLRPDIADRAVPGDGPGDGGARPADDPGRADDDSCVQDSEDALLSGDRAVTPGTARAALAQPQFRRVFFGAFLSNIGTWMQNLTLGVLADRLTGTAWFIGVVTFAQLGPMLVVSPFGGVIADLFDRRRLMIAIAVQQMVLSLGLAALVWDGDPNKAALVAVVLGIGIGNACNAPTYSAVLPALVGRENLAGAVSLNSAQMNLSRVFGPVIAGFVLANVARDAWVFVINAATFVFIIGALWSVRLEAMPKRTGESGMSLLRGGLQVARTDLVIRRVLITVAVLSGCSLVFIQQMPKFAREHLGLVNQPFTFLFATFGVGAALGAISLGTFLSGRSLPHIIRAALVAFAAALAAFALNDSPVAAYPLAFCLGLGYFLVITSLMTVLQERVDDAIRGRVMGLWMMAWGGLVPVGGLVFGPIIDLTDVSLVMVLGAVVALGLAWYADPSGAGQAGSPKPAPAADIPPAG